MNKYFYSLGILFIFMLLLLTAVSFAAEKRPEPVVFGSSIVEAEAETKAEVEAEEIIEFQKKMAVHWASLALLRFDSCFSKLESTNFAELRMCSSNGLEQEGLVHLGPYIMTVVKGESLTKYHELPCYQHDKCTSSEVATLLFSGEELNYVTILKEYTETMANLQSIIYLERKTLEAAQFEFSWQYLLATPYEDEGEFIKSLKRKVLKLTGSPIGQETLHRVKEMMGSNRSNNSKDLDPWTPGSNYHI